MILQIVDNKIKLSHTLITRKQAAELLDCSEGTLSIWACTKRYPLPYIKIGRKVRYRLEDVQNFIDNNLNLFDKKE